ncbi:SDR family oxidoreductase [Leifsonia sp. NPDC056824]|uniref:SDR family oxidoreductase n=1 Tax=Leifsonia sp. NPDC056824 TaxID=3345953 RepID=UPI003696D307
MILIAGGTGRLGTAVREELEPGQVRVLTRNDVTAGRIREGGSEAVIGDLADAETVSRAVEGCRAVVLAASGFGPMGRSTPAGVDRDGNIALIHAARTAGVEHVVLISMHGAAPDARLPLLRMKWAAEEALRASGAGWTIVRPTAFLETYLDAVGADLPRNGSTLVFGPGTVPVNFVSVEDVAALVGEALRNPHLLGETVEWGGEDLTLGQLSDALQSATGVAGPTKRIPIPALRMMALASRPFSPFLARVASAAVIMNTTDMTFDAAPHRARYPGLPHTTLAQAATSWADVHQGSVAR